MKKRNPFRTFQLAQFLAASISVVFVAGCPTVDIPPAEDGTIDVTMRGHSFDPMEVTIQRGEKVRWINTEAGFIPHTSTSGDPADDNEGEIWNSGSVGAGRTFIRQFDEVGEFEYHCTFHWQMGMRGARVIVVEADNQQP